MTFFWTERYWTERYISASLLLLASLAPAGWGQEAAPQTAAAAAAAAPAESLPPAPTPVAPAPGRLVAASLLGGGRTLTLSSASATETLHIVVGQSVILRDAYPLQRIYVGNPAILQSYTSAPEEVVITAKTAGVSSLAIWDSLGKSCLYTVSADVDTSGLRRSLADAYPSSPVETEALQDRIRLTGVVPTPEVSDGIVKLASVYSKEIANSLRIVPVHGKQVELKLRILEVDRTKLEQFGVNIFKPVGNTVGSVSTGMFSSAIGLTGATATAPATVSATNPLNLFLYNFGHGTGLTLQDLAQRNVLQILAEPTLTTISGLPAHFLSGGEFPFPVAQASGGGSGSTTAITIQFRSYGIKVDFLPTVNEDGTIRLKVSPEVSTLDYSNSVTISGFSVPALSTRRAETEVELRDGQTFMLSGLLDRRTTDLLSHMPGIASVPILGELFKSKNNTHSVVELVVMVSVSIVDPLHDPVRPEEPHWALPNLDVKTFDKALGKATQRDVH